MTAPTFIAGEVLTATEINKVGLWKIADYTSTAGSGTITCAAAFSADYEMYRILIRGGSTSATANVRFAFSGITSGYYDATIYGTYAGAAPLTVGNANQAQWDRVANGTTTGVSGAFDVFVAADQKWFGSVMPSIITTGSAMFSAGYNTSTSAATGFTLTTSTGTFNADVKITVYGYKL